MRLEWDERKRLSNLAKHGLDFLDAELIFRGQCYSYPSTRQGEARWGDGGHARGTGGRDRVDSAWQFDPAHLLSESEE
jgi:uncharacterized DUF497 family protein